MSKNIGRKRKLETACNECKLLRGEVRNLRSFISDCFSTILQRLEDQDRNISWLIESSESTNHELNVIQQSKQIKQNPNPSKVPNNRKRNKLHAKANEEDFHQPAQSTRRRRTRPMECNTAVAEHPRSVSPELDIYFQPNMAETVASSFAHASVMIESVAPIKAEIYEEFSLSNGTEEDVEMEFQENSFEKTPSKANEEQYENDGDDLFPKMEPNVSNII